MVDVKKLTCLMAKKGIAQSSELIGVSLKEAGKLENYFGVRFPSAYTAFLTHFGRSAGFLSPWMAIYFDDLKEIKESFELHNSQSKHPFSLPERALLIANGENVFDFILCNESDDPSVYRVDFGGDTNKSVIAVLYAKSYSAYLEALIDSSDDALFPDDLRVDEALLPSEDTIDY